MRNQALKPWQIALAFASMGAVAYVLWPVFPCGRPRTKDEQMQELARSYFGREIGKLVAAGKPQGEITLPDKPDADGYSRGATIRQHLGQDRVGYTVHEHQGKHMYFVFDLKLGRALSSGRYERWHLEESQRERKAAR